MGDHKGSNMGDHKDSPLLSKFNAQAITNYAL